MSEVSKSVSLLAALRPSFWLLAPGRASHPEHAIGRGRREQELGLGIEFLGPREVAETG